MSASAKHGSRKSHRRLILTGVFCLLILAGLLAVQAVRAEGRILPNVSVGGINVGKLAPEEAAEKLRTALRALNVGGIAFSYRDRSLTVRAEEAGAATPSQAPVSYDIDEMVRRAYAFGHSDGWLELMKANALSLFSRVDLSTKVAVDKNGLREILRLRFGGLEQLPKDAEVKISAVETLVENPEQSATTTPLAPVIRTEYRADVVPHADGVVFDYDGAIEQATGGLGRWRGGMAELAAARQEPAITASKAEANKNRLLTIMEKGQISLAYDDLTWPVNPETLRRALTLKAGPDGAVRIGARSEHLGPLIAEAVKKIEIESKPTRLKIENGRATEFEGGQVGKRINLAASLEAIEERLDDGSFGLIPLIVDITPSADSDPIAEELGIRELLGYGTSNFAGSPKNRRKNIANGVKLLYGWIIKPGEEFGLLEHLKPFDDSNGYLQELVIKGKRTVPEYGGGLCQIGTTTFRATMGAGLPVTMRQNHSYRVRYYEPAGTDATMYDPAPDYRFLNDTANHVLLITRIVGDNILRFEFWGTRDGRVQKQSKVKLWDETPPPAPKLIETSELAEGVKKCFEVGHPGAKTSFTYTITYPDGRAEEKEFRSVYKPWQEQCLIGKPGAPRIILQKDGALKELPPKQEAAAPLNPFS